MGGVRGAGAVVGAGAVGAVGVLDAVGAGAGAEALAGARVTAGAPAEAGARARGALARGALARAGVRVPIRVRAMRVVRPTRVKRGIRGVIMGVRERARAGVLAEVLDKADRCMETNG
jgi:hypothetical protein